MIILAGKESAKPKLIKLSGLMENYEGDLADVVRATTTTTTAAEAAAVIPATWQFPRHYSQELGDPFSYILQNIHTHDAPPVVSEFLYNSNTADTDRVNLDEMKRPAANMFSRMLQIAPLSSSSSSHNSPPPILLSNSSCSAGLRISSPRNTGIKRRKSQSKKVVCIPAPARANSRATGEIVPSDLWAWRKYGQKPIKGSPYPRGYYKCSSSKGCSARKQVERSRTDPNMLVITYTSEHNHPWPTQRNALAGSTRSQPSKFNEKPPKQEIENSWAAGAAVEEADHELHSRESDQGFPKMYKPTFTDSQNHERDNFFADLGEIGEDPLNLFQRGFSHIDDLDPLNFYDWATNSSSF